MLYRYLFLLWLFTVIGAPQRPISDFDKAQVCAKNRVSLRNTQLQLRKLQWQKNTGNGLNGSLIRFDRT